MSEIQRETKLGDALIFPSGHITVSQRLDEFRLNDHKSTKKALSAASAYLFLWAAVASSHSRSHSNHSVILIFRFIFRSLLQRQRHRHILKHILKEPCGIENSLRTQLIDWCLLPRVEGMYTRKHYSNALKGLSADLVLRSEIHVREVSQVIFSCLLKIIICIQMSHFVPYGNYTELTNYKVTKTVKAVNVLTGIHHI